MKVAVAGCCHGHLDDIYATLVRAQEREGIVVDLLLCCGDFQAVRNSEDLSCMAVPNKYKTIGDFYKYYAGLKKAPILTIFIGGNHEASNHLRELGFGGWVAPNIYYLGYAGVVRVGGVRIVGISGIYKSGDYHKGHFEAPPYNPGTLRSAYHVRSCDVFQLKQLTGPVDIMLSHDWPTGIHRYGNTEQLLRVKPFLREDIQSNQLGSPPCEDLLHLLQPSYWFSAHLHCKFSAVYHHEGSNNVTKFLALDKPLPRRGFLQILDIPTPSDFSPIVQYDPEWMGVVKLTHPLMSYSRQMWLPPSGLTDERVSFTPTELELDEVNKLFNGDFTIPNNFAITSSPHIAGDRVDFHTLAVEHVNPQTEELCCTLGISNPFGPQKVLANPDEITLDTSSSEAEDRKEEEEEPGDGDRKERPLGIYPWLEDDENDGGDSHVQHVTSARSSLVLPPPRNCPPLQLPLPHGNTVDNSSNPEEIQLPSEGEEEDQTEQIDTRASKSDT